MNLQTGRGKIVFIFRKWFSKCSTFLSTGVLVYKDLKTRLAKDLFFLDLPTNYFKKGEWFW